MVNARASQQTDYLTNDDPETEPSDDENDANIDGKQMKLVYRRDQYGNRYRNWEQVEDSPSDMILKWVTDPSTGRQYKQYVPAVNKARQSEIKVQYSRQPVGSSISRRSQGQPHTSRERLPTFVPLSTSEKEGKPESKSNIVDWARKCPVLWADKLNA